MIFITLYSIYLLVILLNIDRYVAWERSFKLGSSAITTFSIGFIIFGIIVNLTNLVLAIYWLVRGKNLIMVIAILIQPMISYKIQSKSLEKHRSTIVKRSVVYIAAFLLTWLLK